MTVADLIKGSLRLLGVIASGETPTANEQTDAFNALNDLVDSMSTEGLLIPNKIRETFVLVGGQQTYTMGVGGNFNTSRPISIENAVIIPTSSPTIELPVTIFNKDQFAAILLKSLQSTIPLYLYNDNSYPLTNVNVWPVPSDASSLGLYSWKPLADFVATTDTLSLPPGYNRMLRYNLAVELAPEYGKTLTPEALAIAVQSKENCKRANVKEVLLQTEVTFLDKGRNPFNWLTGDTV